ncbi:hypothetical protein B0T22DRAFT_13035 [Podospora appendiculata]|uniref:BRCT domain-containing protein n=1 Tax=Podospora appendiculata TaxID=314037 RepID=A0AAE0XFB5_9PEZI|nr:hypothetical protein B0T22DRAFT_13035 [Podospora appendiculata]
MPIAKQKPIFEGLTIALAGELGGQWTETNIARWVGLREGTFVQQMDESVTHLVCSAEEFKKNGPKVKAALSRKGKCDVVTLDWLEDSMHKARRVPEGQFSLIKALKAQRKKERDKVKIAKGLEQAEKSVNPNFYHIYCDSSYFFYKVTLDGKVEGERYILSLHESNSARPHMYWFVAKYYRKKGHTQALYYRPSECPGRFDGEYAHFKAFFQTKTGVPWDLRLSKAATGDFTYTPPTGGKPVGFALEPAPEPDPSSADEQQQQQLGTSQTDIETEIESPKPLHYTTATFSHKDNTDAGVETAYTAATFTCDVVDPPTGDTSITTNDTNSSTCASAITA